jgi:hypothetical protein
MHDRFFLLGYQYSNNINQLDECSRITYIMPLETAAATTVTFPGRQQKTRQSDVAAVGMKALDTHIERLEAKLLFLIRSYDASHIDLLYQYDKKIATVQQEIDDAIEQRRR